VRLLKPDSLAFNLVWKVCLIQTATIALALSAMVLTYGDRRSAYIDWKTSDQIASAISVGAQGLEADPPKVALAVPRPPATFWFAAADERGRRLGHGEVPVQYRPLVARLDHIEQTDIRTRINADALAVRVVVVDRPEGRLHVAVGGIPERSIVRQLLLIFRYLGGWIALPVLVITLVVAPWVIHRALRGVNRVAAQAAAIQVNERGSGLDTRAVPLEIYPLVDAFNAAVRRIGESYDAQDRFLAGAAHELRMPIAILATRLADLPPGEARSRLQLDLSRLSNIAEQLLDLQRLDRHGSQSQRIDLSALTREVAADVAPLVVDAGYACSVDPPAQPIWVRGDPHALHRVIASLLQNAIAHGGGRGMIAVALHDDGSLSVSDEGPGVPEAERLSVFEPFHRLRPSGSGSGLGLHLAREIVLRHAGTIAVDSAPGGGARFLVVLPVDPRPVLAATPA